MRILITYGSKRGGTQGIAGMLAQELRAHGCTVVLLPPHQVPRKLSFDAVLVGGALYANRWHRAARRFVAGREKALRALPVWLFSSGPLDDSAGDHPIPPVPQVQALMQRIGAQGHVTFGGRLRLDARGFPASAMAKKHSGDWRRLDPIRQWAGEILRALPTAHPLPPVEQPGHSWTRLVYHGLAGWAACAAVMMLLLWTTGLRTALLVHGLVAPLVFTGVAWSYFHRLGARAPLAAASTFAGLALVLDAAAGFLRRDTAMLTSVAGFWLPLAMIFLLTWAVGAMVSMMPAPRAPLHRRS